MSDQNAGYVIRLQLPSQRRLIDELTKKAYGDEVEVYARAYGFVVFDEATPGGWTYSRPGKTTPTVFATEQEATSTIRRVNARTRLKLEGGGAVNLGRLLEKATVVPHSEMVATDEVARELREEKAAAVVEKRVAKVAAAEAEAEKAREALRAAGGEVPKPQSGATDWTAAGDTPGVQRRTRQDGQLVFRARHAGKVSESFATVAEATTWRDQRVEQAAAVAAVMADPERAGIA